MKLFQIQEQWTNNGIWLKLKTNKHFYIEDSTCSHLSYYECLASLVKQSNVTCVPFSLRSIDRVDLSEIRSCENDPEELENAWFFIKFKLFYDEATTKCLKSCIMQEYKGNIDYEELRAEPSNVFHLVFRFAPPYKVKLTEEYVIYDIIEFVASVGGTLGIFIGFSFYDMIIRLINLIKRS